MEVQNKDPQAGAALPPRKRKGGCLKRVFLLLFAAGLFFVFGFIPYFMVDRVVMKGFSLPDKENGDYVRDSFKVAREDISLTSSDGVAVSGWWIPVDSPTPRGTVILVHGLNRSRIEMAKKVEPLHAWGFNCLLIDLRHHGASGVHPITFGLTEKFDVKAAVDYAVSKAPGPVILWGVSLGGATVTLEAADDPRVSGLITDSAYDSLPNTVRHHLNLARGFRPFGLPILKLVPTWPTANIVLFWMRQRGGFEPNDVNILEAAAKMKDRPTLFVANRGDARIPYAIAEEMTKLAGPRSHMILTESKSHGGAWRDARELYEPAVKRLLDEAAPAPPPPPPAPPAPPTSAAKPASKVTPQAKRP